MDILATKSVCVNSLVYYFVSHNCEFRFSHKEDHPEERQIGGNSKTEMES